MRHFEYQVFYKLTSIFELSVQFRKIIEMSLRALKVNFTCCKVTILENLPENGKHQSKQQRFEVPENH